MDGEQTPTGPMSWREVRLAEWEDIHARRLAGEDRLGVVWGAEAAARTRAGWVNPTPEAFEAALAPEGRGGRLRLTSAWLFGVALSGGGVRSAIFNLGILQALDRHGILPFVDYLSTVSGGSYLGGAWSASASGGSEASRFPFRAQPDGSDAPAMVRLRDHSSYMVDDGIDWVRILLVLFRGMLVNLAAILPIPVVAALVIALLAPSGRPDLQSLASWGSWLGGAFAVAVVGCLLFLLSSPLLSWLGARAKGSPALRPRLDRRASFDRRTAVGILLIAGLGLLALQPTLIGWVHGLHSDKPGALAWVRGPLTAGLSGLFSMVSVAAAQLSGRLRGRFLTTVALAVAGLAGIAPPLLVWLASADFFILDIGRAGILHMWWAPCLGLLAWGAYARLVDVNDTSIFNLYRDRLSKAWLWARDADGKLESWDTLALSALSPSGVIVPYHLVGATINLGSSVEPQTRGRNGDFFTFSRRSCGGTRTGWCRTADLEAVAPHLDLGSAVAISAAAAAPNMASLTIGSLRALMTLLNIRMGAWIPNPRQVAASVGKGGGKAHRRWRPGPLALLREATGMLDDRGLLLNASDGGHLENLGIYELLRRRCRLILCGDGAEDKALTFQALATVIRFARIDLGVEIEIDLEELRLGGQGMSRRHAVVGRIRYPETDEHVAEEGLLLYLKLSVTGDEEELIHAYRSANPDFPHQGTVDQFFDEAQLEAYRALGEHVVEDLVSLAYSAGRLEDRSSIRGIGQWMSRLQVALAPQPGGSRSSLPSCVDLPPGLSPPERLLGWQRVYLAHQLDQPSQRRHPAHVGELNAIRLGARDPEIRAAYMRVSPLLDERFRIFCDDDLGLSLLISWEQRSGDPCEGVHGVSRRILEAEISAIQAKKQKIEDFDWLHASLEPPGGPQSPVLVAWARVRPSQGSGGPAYTIERVASADGFDGRYALQRAVDALCQHLRSQGEGDGLESLSAPPTIYFADPTAEAQMGLMTEGEWEHA